MQAYLLGRQDKEDLNKARKDKNINLLPQNIGGNEEMKNVSKRTDGRWQYRKVINGTRIYVYANTQKELLQKIKKQKTQRLTKINVTTKIAIDLINEWYVKYKSNIKSAVNYKYCIKKYFANNVIFKKDINKLTYIELETFLQSIKEHGRTQKYCYYVLKGTFEYAYKIKVIKENIIPELTKPKHKSKKGSSFSLKEQKLLLENLDRSGMKYEILFYLLIGCRRSEAKLITLNDIDFENNSIFVKGTKTETDAIDRYVPFSNSLKKILQENFKNMFKYRSDTYTTKFNAYLKFINIENHKLHDLRHTFSTNLYYLGVPDKERQYYLGHKSIAITNDIYTHLDPNITKEQILNLYKDLYPEF